MMENTFFLINGARVCLLIHLYRHVFKKEINKMDVYKLKQERSQVLLTNDEVRRELVEGLISSHL